MRINISGVITDEDKVIMRQAIQFYADMLMTTRLQSTLVINLRFVEKQKNLAECCWLGNDPVRPKSFSITVRSSATLVKKLKALAHEVVHIKQFATGELIDMVSTNYEEVKWKGKRYVYSDTDHDLYWTAPWEIEAYGRETGLYQLYKRYIKAIKLQSNRSI